jgi:hypothetical protein
MDDKFLHDMRRNPPAAFSHELRAALEEHGHADGASLLRASSMRWLGAAASVAVVAVAFSFPVVRAGAQSFLDLFRVVQFAAVSFDGSRLEQISFEGLDIPTMLGEQPGTRQEQPTPVSYASADEASAAVGFDVLEPAWIPVGWSRTELVVTSAHSFAFTARTALLDVVLEQLAIEDVIVPPALDGATVSIDVPATAQSVFSRGEQSVRLIQANNPQMRFPAGIEPAEVAEIGLRILGLDRDEAYRLAWTIDWRSTLLVPVPVAEASFREVTVGGSTGVLIVPAGEDPVSMLLWGTDDRVFAIAGDISPVELQTIAQSAQ